MKKIYISLGVAAVLAITFLFGRAASASIPQLPYQMMWEVPISWSGPILAKFSDASNTCYVLTSGNEQYGGVSCVKN